MPTHLPPGPDSRPRRRATASPAAPTYAAGTAVTITATPDPGYGLSGWTVDGAPAGVANPLPLTMNADHTVAAAFASTGPPPDLVAPPLDPTAPTSVFDATSFLHTGPGAVQVGVPPGTIQPDRVAVLRGKVLTPDGQPLPGALITVLDHPELGRTQSRADGMFDLAVNGGGRLTVQYAKAGLISAQRQVVAPWEDFAPLPDVVLVPFDTQVTTVDLASSEPVQVARGTAVTDASGTRQATLLFDQGTTATMTMPDGSTRPLTSLDVRATELTVGERGRASMPADLPPTSGYTYATELSVDAAVAAEATDVRFNKPVVFYVENFLGFPVGMDVPMGYYDRARAAWVPSDDGRVIAVVGETAGKADVDVTGDGGGRRRGHPRSTRDGRRRAGAAGRLVRARTEPVAEPTHPLHPLGLQLGVGTAGRCDRAHRRTASPRWPSARRLPAAWLGHHLHGSGPGRDHRDRGDALLSQLPEQPLAGAQACARRPPQW